METKTKLSSLWLFVTLNYIYCDVLGLMNPSMLKGFLNGRVAGVVVSQGFLLASGALVEIPMAMVLLSRLLGYRANRAASVVAGLVMTAVQLGSNLIGTPTPYYIFFSIIEIASTVAVVWFASTWRHELSSTSIGTTSVHRQLITSG